MGPPPRPPPPRPPPPPIPLGGAPVPPRGPPPLARPPETSSGSGGFAGSHGLAGSRSPRPLPGYWEGGRPPPPGLTPVRSPGGWPPRLSGSSRPELNGFSSPRPPGPEPPGYWDGVRPPLPGPPLPRPPGPLPMSFRSVGPVMPSSPPPPPMSGIPPPPPVSSPPLPGMSVMPSSKVVGSPCPASGSISVTWASTLLCRSVTSSLMMEASSSSCSDPCAPIATSSWSAYSSALLWASASPLRPFSS